MPELLGELAGTREHQEHALYELYGNIWHQGTVYEATAHAVPFLARLALSEPAPLRDELLALLAHIANGSSYLEVHQDLVPGGLTEDERDAMKEELANVEAARAAVLDSLPQLVEKVMAEPTPGGHALIARLAAAFPDHQAVFHRRPAARRQLFVGTNESGRATLLRWETEMLRGFDCVQRIPSRSQDSQNSPRMSADRFEKNQRG